MGDPVRFVGERERCAECLEHIGHLSTCSKYDWPEANGEPEWGKKIVYSTWIEGWGVWLELAERKPRSRWRWNARGVFEGKVETRSGTVEGPLLDAKTAAARAVQQERST